MAQQQRRKAQQQSSGGSGNKTFLILAGAVVLIGGGWLYAARGGSATGPIPTPAEFEAMMAGLEADPSVGIPIGSESAPITLEEFYDFSCPACANFSGFAGKLIRQNYVETGSLEGGGGPVRWISYDYVLGSFPNSVPAALAGRCANEQGRYFPMHDLLLSRQTRWYLESDPAGVLEEIAEDVGLDIGAYRECMSESRYLEEVATSRKYGDSRGVGSTPTLFLDGEKLDLGGKEPYSYIEGLIQAKLEAMSSGAP